MNYVGYYQSKIVILMKLIFDNRNIRGSSFHKLIYKKIIHQLMNTMKFSVWTIKGCKT